MHSSHTKPCGSRVSFVTRCTFFSLLHSLHTSQYHAFLHTEFPCRWEILFSFNPFDLNIFTFFIPFNCILGSRARVTDAYIRWKKNIYIALKSLLFTAIWISEWRALWSSVTNGGERCYMLSRCQRIHYIVLFLFILFAVCGNARCSLPFEVLNAGGAFLYRQQFRWLFSSILFAATQMLFFYLLMAFDKYWFDRFIFGVFPDVAIVGCVKACGMVNKSIIGDR